MGPIIIIKSVTIAKNDKFRLCTALAESADGRYCLRANRDFHGGNLYFDILDNECKSDESPIVSVYMSYDGALKTLVQLSESCAVN